MTAPIIWNNPTLAAKVAKVAEAGAIDQLREVDLGSDGVCGAYLKFMRLLGKAGVDASTIAGAWLFLMWHPPARDYPLAPGIGVILVVKIALALWALWAAVILAQAFLNGMHWLGQEAAGMQWALADGQMRRVTFYRKRDDVLRTDDASREERVREEASGRLYRRHALIQDTAWLAVLLGLYWLLPTLFAYAHDLLGDGIAGFVDRYGIPLLARWILLFFLVGSRLVAIAQVLLEWAIYASGAQFMLGAKVQRQPEAAAVAAV